MKRIFFLALLISSIGLSAQTKLGLKLAPVIASNRATNDAQTVDSDGSSLKMSVGLIVDKPLSETYFLSTGLVYVPKMAAFRTDSATSEEYKLQYLQIPVTLKLFTNEVAPDIKVFFQVGGAMEIKVFDEAESPNFDTITKFNPADFSVILGSGVEYRAGINTTLFGGISYQRGLANTVSDTINGAEDLQIRNTIFSIDLGVKF